MQQNSNRNLFIEIMRSPYESVEVQEHKYNQKYKHQRYPKQRRPREPGLLLLCGRKHDYAHPHTPTHPPTHCAN